MVEATAVKRHSCENLKNASYRSSDYLRVMIRIVTIKNSTWPDRLLTQPNAQETARQVQIGVCTNADNSSTMKKEGFSYEYHYKTKDGLALTDFKVTTCE